MKTDKNILIVEDESIVAMELSSYLETLGLNVVFIAYSGYEALEAIEKFDIDLILMDIHLKGDIDGIECAKKIKKIKDIPLIYLTAYCDDETLERAILTKPSSYLIKPINRNELKVAVKIALKNLTNKYQGDIIFDEEFSFDSKNKELIASGEFVHLTKQEKELLELLVLSKNNIVSIYEIENSLWPDKQSNENTRRALISRLRLKLKNKFLETVHSIGYRLKI
jgi:DNA-binding response OmpR family regulator